MCATNQVFNAIEGPIFVMSGIPGSTNKTFGFGFLLVLAYEQAMCLNLTISTFQSTSNHKITKLLNLILYLFSYELEDLGKGEERRASLDTTTNIIVVLPLLLCVDGGVGME